MTADDNLPHSTAALLSVQGLEGGYGTYKVLHGASLHIDPGEVVAILGPNGHGKSTLLRMISGLLRPSAGVILFRNRPIHTASASDIVRLGISHAPQGDLIFARMSVKDNLLAGAYLNWTDHEQRLEEMLVLFPALRRRLRVSAGMLSGGERRMLAIARALMSNPSLLMFDEPSLGLAPLIRDAVYEQMHRIVASGVATLLVEEKVSHLEDLADRVYVMESGRVVIEGSTERVLKDSAALLEAYVG